MINQNFSCRWVFVSLPLAEMNDNYLVRKLITHTKYIIGFKDKCESNGFFSLQSTELMLQFHVEKSKSKSLQCILTKFNLMLFKRSLSN